MHCCRGGDAGLHSWRTPQPEAGVAVAAKEEQGEPAAGADARPETAVLMAAEEMASLVSEIVPLQGKPADASPEVVVQKPAQVGTDFEKRKLLTEARIGHRRLSSP